MKTKKLMSLLLAVVVVVFGLPQYGVKAEAATTNYQRAKAEYQTVYNVADYGVDTTGKRDCGAKITSLIKTLVKARAEDDSIPVVIYMPSGKYKITSPIKLNTYKNLHLIAERDTIVTAGKSLRDMVEIQKTSNVSVLGGKWDGKNKVKYNFKIYEASDITISECLLTRASERGIHIAASTITLNSIRAYKNKKFGISSAQSADITMRNSRINSNGQHGVVIASSTLHMENGANKLYNNGNSGVSVSGSTGKLYASGNTFTGNGKAKNSNGHGIGVAQGAYAEISNNKIEKNKQCGISLISKAKAVVTGNSIKKNGRHGIGSAENCTLIAESNTITSNKWHGIMIRDKGTGTITNNYLSNNKVSGLSVDNLTKYVTVTGNTIYKNKSNGIIVTKARVKLTDNTIRKNKAFGVFAWRSATVRIVSGNVIRANRKSDVANDSSKVRIGKNNTVRKVRK